jgi:hypothetical protein
MKRPKVKTYFWPGILALEGKQSSPSSGVTTTKPLSRPHGCFVAFSPEKGEACFAFFG